MSLIATEIFMSGLSRSVAAVIAGAPGSVSAVYLYKTCCFEVPLVWRRACKNAAAASLPGGRLGYLWGTTTRMKYCLLQCVE